MPLIIVSTCPTANGMYTFFRNLRTGLAAYGWEVRCVTTGAQEHAELIPEFADEHWVSLVPMEADAEHQRRAFADWCEAAQPAVIIPMISDVAISAIPLLPPSIQVVMRCTFSSRRGYEAVTKHLDRTACIVTPTPFHGNILREDYGVDPAKIVLIEHGTALIRPQARLTSSAAPIKIAYLGRINHAEKGSLYIPPILQRLDAMAIPFHLEIAGSGPDIDVLCNHLAPFIAATQVSLLGDLQPSQIADFLARAEVFLFTSREEGFSNSLMEAMGLGCVPVASLLPGITDYIIRDERMGMLCEPGNVDCFAAAIAALAQNRDRLHAMSMAAYQQVRSNFNLELMALKYAKLLDRVTQLRYLPSPPTPLP